jgi:hypothetical protein
LGLQWCRLVPGRTTKTKIKALSNRCLQGFIFWVAVRVTVEIQGSNSNNSISCDTMIPFYSKVYTRISIPVWCDYKPLLKPIKKDGFKGFGFAIVCIFPFNFHST